VVDTFKSIDLFAGAGGLSCGLQKAGFHPIFAAEINKTYAATYEQNHPGIPVAKKDIRDLSNHEVMDVTGLKPGDLDLLAGGPPCQGFSINAPIRSLDDQRNHLFKEYLRIAKVLMPKVLLIENVPGIISLGKGTVVKAIYEELDCMGYSVQHKILFAGHYGAPQMRFRTVFIAARDHGDVFFPTPEYDSTARANFFGAKELCFNIANFVDKPLKPQTSTWDAISDLPALRPGDCVDAGSYSGPPLSDYQRILRAGSERLYNHACTKLGKCNLDRLKYIPQGGSWRDIPYDLLPAGLKRARRSDHTKRYGRLHPDQMCSTILTKCDPHWGSFFHPTQDRAISVREAARIQSFPDHYVFTGNLTEQYEQVGNAVPPLMAAAIGKSVKRMIS
jgi:DNA (cytosine-5)-methyltransferase 1